MGHASTVGKNTNANLAAAARFANTVVGGPPVKIVAGGPFVNIIAENPSARHVMEINTSASGAV